MVAAHRLWTGDVIEGLQVQVNGTPNMTVVVGQGSAFIATGSYPSSYKHVGWNDTTTGTPAGESVTITTAPASNSRIDAIVAYVDYSVTTSSATADNPGVLKFAAVAGTPAASPTAPTGSAIQSAIGASNPYILLAYVTVGTNVTQINSGNIADKRTFAKLGPNNIGLGPGINTVATSQTTTSTGYTDLTTSGPSVTVNIGANGIAIVMLSAEVLSASDAIARMSFAASGANTVSPSDPNSLSVKIVSGVADITCSVIVPLTNLAAGSTTFTAKYKTTSGTATFASRTLTVIPL